MEIIAGIIVALGGLMVGIHRLVKYLLDFVERMQTRHEGFLRDQAMRNETFLENHMSSNTETIVNLTNVTGKLVTAVNTLHKDNVTTAKILKKADEDLVRLVATQEGE